MNDRQIKKQKRRADLSDTGPAKQRIGEEQHRSARQKKIDVRAERQKNAKFWQRIEKKSERQKNAKFWQRIEKKSERQRNAKERQRYEQRGTETGIGKEPYRIAWHCIKRHSKETQLRGHAWSRTGMAIGRHDGRGESFDWTGAEKQRITANREATPKKQWRSGEKSREEWVRKEKALFCRVWQEEAQQRIRYAWQRQDMEETSEDKSSRREDMQ